MQIVMHWLILVCFVIHGALPSPKTEIGRIRLKLRLLKPRISNLSTIFHEPPIFEKTFYLSPGQSGTKSPSEGGASNENVKTPSMLDVHSILDRLLNPAQANVNNDISTTPSTRNWDSILQQFQNTQKQFSQTPTASRPNWDLSRISPLLLPYLQEYAKKYNPPYQSQSGYSQGSFQPTYSTGNSGSRNPQIRQKLLSILVRWRMLQAMTQPRENYYNPNYNYDDNYNNWESQVDGAIPTYNNEYMPAVGMPPYHQPQSITVEIGQPQSSSSSKSKSLVRIKDKIKEKLKLAAKGLGIIKGKIKHKIKSVVKSKLAHKIKDSAVNKAKQMGQVVGKLNSLKEKLKGLTMLKTMRDRLLRSLKNRFHQHHHRRHKKHHHPHRHHHRHHHHRHHHEDDEEEGENEDDGHDDDDYYRRKRSFNFYSNY